MENARIARYNGLLESFKDTLGDSSVTVIQSTLEQMRIYADRAFNNDLSRGQNMEAMEELPIQVSGGLQQIMRLCWGARPGYSEFSWLGQNYGPAISFGAQGKALGFSYESEMVHPRAISVRIVPRTASGDELIRDYISARDSGDVSAPGLAQLFFEEKKSPDGKAIMTLEMGVSYNMIRS